MWRCVIHDCALSIFERWRPPNTKHFGKLIYFSPLETGHIEVRRALERHRSWNQHTNSKKRAVMLILMVLTLYYLVSNINHKADPEEYEPLLFESPSQPSNTA